MAMPSALSPDTPSAAGLSFDRVACARGGRLIFRGQSFRLGPGDALLLSGPNGVGKSSLIRLAAGLIPAFSGTVTRRGRAALLDDRTALDARVPLARALAFWARLDGGSRDTAHQALHQIGLEALADVPVGMLSTGQRRRAAFARVLASKAPIWLLDEPANALDPLACARLAQHIADHRQRGGVVVIATHFSFDVDGAIHHPMAPIVDVASGAEGEDDAADDGSCRAAHDDGEGRAGPSCV